MTNPPAFPAVHDLYDPTRGTIKQSHSQGIDTRTYIATHLMQGELACQTEYAFWNDDNYNKLAQRCVAIADALMSELAKDQKPS